jgi:hypothetical protein
MRTKSPKPRAYSRLAAVNSKMLVQPFSQTQAVGTHGIEPLPGAIERIALVRQCRFGQILAQTGQLGSSASILRKMARLLAAFV